MATLYYWQTPKHKSILRKHNSTSTSVLFVVGEKACIIGKKTSYSIGFAVDTSETPVPSTSLAATISYTGISCSLCIT